MNSSLDRRYDVMVMYQHCIGMGNVAGMEDQVINEITRGRRPCSILAIGTFHHKLVSLSKNNKAIVE